MNNLDIVVALFTTPNHKFSRLDLDTTAAFQAATSATSNWVQQNSSQTDKLLRLYQIHIRLLIYQELSLLYHLFEGVCFGRRRHVAVLKS